MKIKLINKQKILFWGCLLLAIILVVLGISLSNDTSSNGKKETSIEDELVNMGSLFYENFYYESVSDSETTRKVILKQDLLQDLWL